MTKNQEKPKSNKALSVIGIILCVILVPILVINATLIIKSFINKDKVPDFAGIMPMIVLTDSMSPEILSGDLVICQTADPASIKEGDVISFFDPEGNGQSVVTHRVLEVLDENGELSFVTKGDANNTQDELPVPAEKLVGIYKTRLQGVGNVAMFMQTTVGLIVCIAVPIILLVLYDILRRRSYEKSKNNEKEELMAELERLRAEKQEREKNDLDI